MSRPRTIIAVIAISLTTDGARLVNAQCHPEQAAKVLALDGGGNDELGYSVALDGDTAIVGAWVDNLVAGADAGSAYVFIRGTDGAWTQQAKLTASDAAAGDRFGIAVAVHGDTAVVGSGYDDVSGYMDVGSAYVFVRGADGTWMPQAKLTPWDYQGNDRFGCAVAMDGDTVLVGAYLHDTWYHEPEGGSNSGSAYLFVRTATEWSFQKELTIADSDYSIEFGRSVALSGNTAIVGSPRDDVGSLDWAGTAHVFVSMGGAWIQQASLAASNGAAYDNFGYAVAIEGDTAIVGANYKNLTVGALAGAAYAFTRNEGVWTQQAYMTASEGGQNHELGYAVAVRGDLALIGTGGHAAAYLFRRGGGTWTEAAMLEASDPGPNDEFGNAVAVSGGAAIVGAHLDNNANGTKAGSAYVFDLGCIILGDLNGDGVIDGGDVQGFLDCLFGAAANCAAADLDGDGDVDDADRVLFVEVLLGP